MKRQAASSILHPAAGLAVLVMATALGGSAAAQVTHTHGSYNDMVKAEAAARAAAAKPAPPPAPDDGLSGDGFYLEADELVQKQALHHVEATGAVEARYQGRVLRADHVDYDTQSGVVVASGHVVILAADGTAQFADQVTLDKAMSTGFAGGFATRLADHLQIAAASAHRRADQVTELEHVIYTPCQVCAANGQRRPTWSIRARRVIEDKRRKTLTFRDAVIEVKGQPVFYFPVLISADPAAERKSGLLLPLVTFSGERGFSYEQPYYQVITPSQDITISPQINSKVNPFLNVDYRRRFYSGVVDVRAGYTFDQDFTSGGTKFGAETSRSYILGSGVFRIDPNWIWGFTAERASDKLIFDKYSIGDVFTDRGLYAADDRRLISQIYAVRQDAQSYISVAAINVEGLRFNDLQSTFPTIAPLIEARWEPAEAILGGRLRLDASGVALARDQVLPASPALDAGGVPATDDRRATAQADWQRTFTFANGLRVAPFLDGRVDLYNVAGQALTPSGATLAREYGALGATVTYPLTRTVGDLTWVLEPTAQFAVSPNIKPDPRIPNEDSIDFEYDETNLFEINRSPGYDLLEGGQSVTLGGRATAEFADGRNASFLIGRRFAADKNLDVPGRTGLRSALSDYVVAADATLIKDIWVFSRLRLASDAPRVDSFEVGARFLTARFAGYASYLEEARSPSYLPSADPATGTIETLPLASAAKVKSLDIHGEAFVTSHWGLTGYAIVDDGVWRRQDFGVVYRDDCIRVEVLYRHDETFNGTYGPSTSVVLRLTLATLGTNGYVSDPRPGF